MTERRRARDYGVRTDATVEIAAGGTVSSATPPARGRHNVVLRRPADLVHADGRRHLAAQPAAALVHAGPRLGRHRARSTRPGTYAFHSEGRLRTARDGDVVAPSPTPTADADRRRRRRRPPTPTPTARRPRRPPPPSPTATPVRRGRSTRTTPRRRASTGSRTPRAPTRPTTASRSRSAATVTFSYPAGRHERRTTSSSTPAKPSSCTQTAGPVIGAAPPLPAVRAARRAGPATARSPRPAPTRSCARRTAEMTGSVVVEEDGRADADADARRHGDADGDRPQPPRDADADAGVPQICGGARQARDEADDGRRSSLDEQAPGHRALRVGRARATLTLTVSKAVARRLELDVHDARLGSRDAATPTVASRSS